MQWTKNKLNNFWNKHVPKKKIQIQSYFLMKTQKKKIKHTDWRNYFLNNNLSFGMTWHKGANQKMLPMLQSDTMSQKQNKRTE